MSNVGWTSAEEVNWDDVSTEPPAPLAVDLYKAVIAKAEPGTTKENKPTITLELSVDSVFKGDAVSPARKMFDNCVLTKEAAFKIKQLAAAAGVAPPANFGLDAVKTFCDALVDSNGVILRSKQTEWQGKKNHKVDRYMTEEQADTARSGGEQSSSASASASAEAPAGGGRRRRAAA